jgi:DNA-binding transcriptional LysR family regulator
LAPRLQRFNRAHPGIDVRVVASNDKPNLERDQLDIAIRFVLAGTDVPDSEPVFDCKIYPACSPALANDKLHPIRTPADLAHHVRLDYESMRDGRRLSLWDFWFDKMKIPHVKPASTLQFPQYDNSIGGGRRQRCPESLCCPHSHCTRKPCAFHSGWAVALLGVFYIIRRRCCWTRGRRGVR